MPLPDDLDLRRPIMLIEDASGALFNACNCPQQPVHRTLRYVTQHRHQFSLPADVKAREDAVIAAKMGKVPEGGAA